MNIASCPKCHEPVSLPVGSNGTTQVRCPWCREEYPLQQALERLPPALIIVPSDQRPAVQDGTAVSASATRMSSDADPFFDDEPTAAERVASDEDLDLEDVIDVPEPDFADQLDQPDRSGEATREARPSRTHQDDWLASSTMQSTALGYGDARSSDRSSAPMPRSRKRRKQAGPIRSFIQIVGGGVLGLAIAQLILWWLPGNWKANRDPLSVADDVARYAPFLVPASLRSPATASSSSSSTKSADPIQQQPVQANENNGSRDRRRPDELVANPAFENDPLPAVQPPPDESAVSETVKNDSDKSVAQPSSSLDERSGDTTPPGSLTTANAEQSGGQNPTANVAASETSASTVEQATGSKEETRPSSPPTSDPSTHEVRGAVSVSEAELSERLAAARSAEQAWDGGASASIDERRTLFRNLYSSYAKLGEALLFLDSDIAADSEVVAESHQLLEDLVKQPTKLNLIGVYGPHWIDQEHDNSGVIIYGTIIDSEAKGELTSVRVKVAARTERDVTLVFPSAAVPSKSAGSKIVAFGTIVDDPAAKLEGWQGPAQPVIFAKFHLEVSG